MPALHLTFNQYLEVEKLAIGAFAPLSGFMDSRTFNSVVSDMRLPDGDPFPLPVVLSVDDDQRSSIGTHTAVDLYYDGTMIGELSVTDIFTCDKNAFSQQVFRTDSMDHPGVRFFSQSGDHMIAGPVRLDRRITTALSEHELSPAETRHKIDELGWKTVVGFQTRNVPHRAHEYLQRVALEHVDGLFIQPLLGRKKAGDYTAEAIIKGYRALIDGFYPASRALFGVLTTSMRYAGPREAVFHAIIRRNYGCTHFIVGRDHAGVGSYYGKYDAHRLTETFDGELGIEIMRLSGPYYCALCDGIVTEKTCPHEATHPDQINHISGTDMRAMLSGGKTPDPRLMRPEVIAALRDTPLFIEDDSE